jgi:hypothetical protein
MVPPLSRRCAILLIFQKLMRSQGSARTIQAVAQHFISDARGLNGQDMRPTEAMDTLALRTGSAKQIRNPLDVQLAVVVDLNKV